MEEPTRRLIQQDGWRMQCLSAVRQLRLPDWYLAAGFLRNAIWDQLHDYTARTPLNDVDLVYFDPTDLSLEAEQQIAASLRTLSGLDANWEVRNQARMHLRNQHAPYRDAEHAIAHWIEVPTCVGVRMLPDDELQFAAPFGLEENYSLHVRPNPHVSYPPELFHGRIASKRWREIWPKLRIVDERNDLE